MAIHVAVDPLPDALAFKLISYFLCILYFFFVQNQDNKRAELEATKSQFKKHASGEYSQSVSGISLLSEFQTNPAAVKAVFSRLDANSDGKVSANELAEGLKVAGINVFELGEQVGASDSDALSKMLDVNGDGSVR